MFCCIRFVDKIMSGQCLVDKSRPSLTAPAQPTPAPSGIALRTKTIRLS